MKTTGKSAGAPRKGFGQKSGPKKSFGKPFGAGGKGKRPFGGGSKRFGDKPREDGAPKRDFGERKRSFGDRDRGFSDRGRDSGERKRSFGDRDRGFSDRGRDSGERKRSFGDRDRGFSDRGRDSGERKRSFSDRDRSGPGQDRPFRDRKPGFGPRKEYPPRRGGFGRRDDERQPRPESREEGPQRPHLGEDELRYLGRNACLALFRKRPQDIVRLYVRRDLAAEFKPLIEYCTEEHKSFHLVEEQDLERLTDSVHHQGICVVARARPFAGEQRFFSGLGSGRALVLFLDGVGNPHNLGAILRTAAHFGVQTVAVPAGELAKISPAIYRTAEGAAEDVAIVRVEDSEKFLDRLEGLGFHLYAFEAGNSQSLFDTRINEKAVFVFGAEVEGVSGLVREIVKTRLAIPGTGAVESLNVSVAAGVAMAEFARQSSTKTVRIVKSPR